MCGKVQIIITFGDGTKSTRLGVIYNLRNNNNNIITLEGKQDQKVNNVKKRNLSDSRWKLCNIYLSENFEISESEYATGFSFTMWIVVGWVGALCPHICVSLSKYFWKKAFCSWYQIETKHLLLNLIFLDSKAILFFVKHQQISKEGRLGLKERVLLCAFLSWLGHRDNRHTKWFS